MEKEKWVEEFEKSMGFKDIKNIGDIKSLKGFIRRLLNDQKEEILKEIEKMELKTKVKNVFQYGYNQALQDIINKIKIC